MTAPDADPRADMRADPRAGVRTDVRVQTDDFDLGGEVARLRAGDARVGAVVSFVGTVRDMNDGASVAELELEHYPG